MSIGERIKMARRGAGLSQRALADAVGVSAMAISKYERDMDVPGSDVLLKLARALGVKTEFFLRPVLVRIMAPAYRRRVSLSRRQEYAIMAEIQEWIERYLAIEVFFDGLPSLDLPNDLDRRVCSLYDVEQVAIGLREGWQLGFDPIESLMAVLEDHGVKVGLVDGYDAFDALTFWANEKMPVIVVKRDLPGDRQRFNLAHELGHLVLELDQGVSEEKAANRFAGAFLVPEPVVYYELGERRSTLDLHELHLLKHKYGLSMQAWIYRAKDLGIISEARARNLFGQFKREGWYRREPGAPLPSEEPERFKRLVMRALSEDMISQSRAAELLGMPLARFWQEEAEQHHGFPTVVRS